MVGTQKWMVYNGKIHLEMDDLGVPLFIYMIIIYAYTCNMYIDYS